ncbi:MAG TPA: hypothetical protein VD884_00150 [Ohtaekwangia sp.]|nr:hypothetical protein [Ohtaekwangia sp.]
MKLTKVFLIGLAIFAAACSNDDDDAKPQLVKQKLSLLEANPITPPTAMANSENPHAQIATTLVSSANIMSPYAPYFETPARATKSISKITESNGRLNDTGDFTTYIWEDDNSEQTIAYQVSEESKSYVFEIFLKLEHDSKWVKRLDVEERKDQSAGTLLVYDFASDNASTKLLEYNWTRGNKVFELTMKTYEEKIQTMHLVYNEKTQAGSISYEGSDVSYEMEWDSNGNGTYTYYDENGDISEEGEW